MKKLKDYIDKWIDGKTVRGITVSQIDIFTLIDAYNAILKGDHFEFISENVKNILNKCGIETEIEGIGYRIKIPPLI